MIKSLLLCVFLYSSIAVCQKKICITVDDLPTVSYSLKTSQVDLLITNKLFNAFKDNNIVAIGFVNESKLYKKGKLDPQKVHLLDLWLQSGLDLGNHTFSHVDYNKVSDIVFFDDLLKGEKVIKPLMHKYGKTPKYFRHPYLHAGSDSISYKKLKTFLNDNNYIVSPVTIDNDDYLFAKSYHNAFVDKNETLMKEIGEKYINYMEQKVLFFESKSKEIFNREITQTLLIHASLLNADYIENLIIMLKKHNYSFVSQEEALKTPEYSTEVTSYTQYGYSWIYRWGFSMGNDKKIMEGDVATPDEIINLSKK
ncbi:polysaccharide deacetylase family protein [Aureibaculum sp. A20]|uniref:Polysaccharide deacetylase family protein n=1 Tax=Aureibaculum flavum TaxID=2795986 RepID=A0ABS0WSY8_9FLAO|nr:polysaccharide deacetylase family protein [Aureibaculum flavum]MBJ2175091.1 polysaccharide deacetylase family protein [Aureibaculum flavum]